MAIDYIEVIHTPARCEGCMEVDCYNCDTAGQRWHITKRQKLEVKKKLRIQAITRYQREIEEIDRQIEILTEGSK